MWEDDEEGEEEEEEEERALNWRSNLSVKSLSSLLLTVEKHITTEALADE